MSVSDVMSRRLITADVSETADRLAERMAAGRVGCIIITSDTHPVGIVTERDLVVKVVSRNIKPSAAKAEELMSRPLITIGPDKSVELASREMIRHRIRRLPVIQGKKLVGLVTDSDLLVISSELSNILRDLIRQNNPQGEFSDRDESGTRPEQFRQGICEVCNSFQEELVNVDGTYVCNRCRDELPFFQ
ncbi:MAG: Inosine-5'-monophosphate dehydrogenase [Methanocella sp. PtaU1.Bin125]|nr:MAG: Inosine-5'-monophosphate dehydrogenase [Methanocella sp. PtaU1.Bin125]